MFAPPVARSGPKRRPVAHRPSSSQPALPLGRVDDPLEREADRIAGRVVDRTDTRLAPPPPIGRAPVPAAAAPPVRTGTAGEALRPADRRFFESRFGRDFDAVRIHRGGEAARSARALGARAYTIGRDIVFGGGEYAPDTHAGRALIAHELTHVVQQGGRPGLVQRSPRSESVKAVWTADPTIEALLARLAEEDIQTAQDDDDVDTELRAILAGRPDDLWVAERIRTGELGKSSGTFGPESEPRQARPVKAYFFRGTTERRALVIAGVHGSERQGIEVAEMLIEELRKQSPAFTTIVVPSLFPDSKARGDTLAAQGKMGQMRKARESGPTSASTHTNRNFPAPPKNLAAAKAEGGRTAIDDLGNKILPENVMLIGLLERFRPERIISIHGTQSPGEAGVFFDRRELRADEVAGAWEWAKKRAGVGKSPLWQDEMGGEAQQEKLEASFWERQAELTEQASKTDRDLSLAAARLIDKEMLSKGGNSLRIRKARNFRRDTERAAIKLAKDEGRTAAMEVLDTQAKAAEKRRSAHPSIGGNVGPKGKIDNATWGGSMEPGVSLGGYGSKLGYSVFTVEPPLNYRSSDRRKLETLKDAQREIELKAYEEAIRTILLGTP